MNIFKYRLKLLVLNFVPMTFLLLSCENDITSIGSNFIPDKPEGNVAYVDLVAYNVFNNDTIRADYATLTNGLVGVYEDNVFGKSKASFNMQVRLSSSSEILGNIQEVDSVILTLNPGYQSSLPTVKQVILNPGSSSGIDTIKYITQYPLLSYIGSKGSTTKMKVKVNRILTFLESSTSRFYSDKVIDVGDLLGTAVLGDSVTSINIKTSEGTTVLESTAAGYRIKLDAAYFKQHFFNKKGSSDISDNSRFIQYFKGIRISPDEDASKFMFSFPKSGITLTAYYRYKDDASSSTYTNATYAFTMNSVYNSAAGEYDFYERNTASSQFKQQMQNPNVTSGEKRLFLQGMGGPSIHLKLDDARIEAVRDSVQNKGWAIIDAKLKFYLAEDAVSKPDYIYGYNLTEKSFLPDLTGYPRLTGYYFNPRYDVTSNPGYYTLNVTQHIKNVVEKNSSNDEILVEMGNFTLNSLGTNYLGYYRTSRAYEPFRLIFYGNQETGDKKLRLEIIYTKK
ncbi:MAG: DUF4270 domain-containing protein [Flavobacteriaceae bacterium]|jgi:hypothetical protein|nr:DUF4270 domain-containing protein [Flavobacteriaceae bacterium]